MVTTAAEPRLAVEAHFREDVRRAPRVCAHQPALPTVTLLVAIIAAWASSRAPGHGLAAFAGLALFGWVGSERLWFLRLYTGRTMTARAALRAALTYWPRVVRLSLLVLIPVIMLSIPIITAAAHALPAGDSQRGHASLPLWALTYSAILSLLIDFSLTFVTPALIYTDRRARSALVTGLSLLRQTSPHAAPYVLIPPLALVILSQLTGDKVGWFGGTLIVVSYLLNLIAKGATASYYLRLRAPAQPDGDIDPGIA